MDGGEIERRRRRRTYWSYHSVSK